MKRVPHALPGEASAAGEFARGQALLVGPAVQAPPASVAEADYLAKGDLLARLSLTVNASQSEAFLTSTAQLVGDWEAVYGLPADSSLTLLQRQTRLVAKVRSLRGGSPQALANMTRAYDATATIYENTPAAVPQPPTVGATDGVIAGGQRAVFQFALRISVASFNDPTILATLTYLLAQMKPAHTAVAIATNDPAVGFLTDDPNSLTDRDVLGS